MEDGKLTLGIDFGSIGVLLWIAFMICDYGYGESGNPFCNALRYGGPHPHFWTWFPLWIVPAFIVSLLLVFLLVAVISNIIKNRHQ